jgi:hypothetical protein
LCKLLLLLFLISSKVFWIASFKSLKQ